MIVGNYEIIIELLRQIQNPFYTSFSVLITEVDYNHRSRVIKFWILCTLKCSLCV